MAIFGSDFVFDDSEIGMELSGNPACATGRFELGWSARIPAIQWTISGLPEDSWLHYLEGMTTTEQVIERVKALTEEQARHLLRLLPEFEHAATRKTTPLGPVAMLGFARRFYPEPRTTAQWLRELREGEE